MLTLNDRIPFGNLAAPETAIADGRNVVRFGPSPHGGLERLWFNFRVANPDGDAAPADTRLILKAADSLLGFRDGSFLPVIRYGDEPWRRLPPGTVVVRDDDLREVYWDVKTPRDYFEIALCFPYGPDDLRQTLADTGDYWRQDEIGVSAAGRPIVRLANTFAGADAPGAGLYLFARQHAAETSGAWVLDGVLRALAELRAPFPVWCVPFADIDGVMNGDYGKNAFPHDLNRAWGPKFPFRHETFTFMKDLHRWRRRIEPARAAVLDFHSPSVDEEGFYAFVNDEAEEAWPARRWLPLLVGALGADASQPFAHIATYKAGSVWGEYHNLREFVEGDLGVFCASFEASYWRLGGRTAEIADYRSVGRRVAESWLAFAAPPAKT